MSCLFIIVKFGSKRTKDGVRKAQNVRTIKGVKSKTPLQMFALEKFNLLIMKNSEFINQISLCDRTIKIKYQNLIIIEETTKNI